MPTPSSRLTEEEVLAFVRSYISSVYTLELLLLVKNNRSRPWHAAELVRDLRSSPTAVAEALKSLQSAGLVSVDSTGLAYFDPKSPAHDAVAAGIEQTYAAKPLSLVKAITTPSTEKLQIFSDAFKLKE
jgi:hypothetical protein